MLYSVLKNKECLRDYVYEQFPQLEDIQQVLYNPPPGRKCVKSFNFQSSKLWCRYFFHHAIVREHKGSRVPDNVEKVSSLTGLMKEASHGGFDCSYVMPLAYHVFFFLWSVQAVTNDTGRLLR